MMPVTWSKEQRAIAKRTGGLLVAIAFDGREMQGETKDRGALSAVGPIPAEHAAEFRKKLVKLIREFVDVPQ
jgi:hypothetical protein